MENASPAAFQKWKQMGSSRMTPAGIVSSLGSR
jgi:hypothetical protein